VALGNAAYPVTAIAVQPSVVRSWTREAVGELLGMTPQVRVNIMREMATHMTDALTRVRELTTARVDQRLAQTLLRLARQCGQAEVGGVLITQPLTRQELADLTGTTLYTVSRTLAKWETQGLLESRKRLLLLKSLQKLQAEAHAEEQ
jgi:CRP-like cAMP-binding protein